MWSRFSRAPIDLRAAAELELRARRKAGTIERPPENWEDWLRALFPEYVSAPMGARHIDFWQWVESVQPKQRPLPLVAVWPRGGAKSTSAELACVRIGSELRRFYTWYISSTQDKADSHVDTIASLLESTLVGKYYPDLASRAIGKYGNAKGWRRSRLRARNGFTVDALGLDTGARGVKVDKNRPDLIILDDIDELNDSFATTEKKIHTITNTILPAGSNDCAVLFIQNMIHPESIATKLVHNRVDFLADKKVSGPYVAINKLAYEFIDGRAVIKYGEPTWAGQSLEVCQSQINTWGLSAFLKEAQQEIEYSGGMWDVVQWLYAQEVELPDMVQVQVWVDPAITATDHSDCQGIAAGGIDENDHVYGLRFKEYITEPEDALETAILWALELGGTIVGVETDQGGDTWQSVFTLALEKVKREHPEYRYAVWPTFASDKAGAGQGSKVERNNKMLADYQRGNVTHVLGQHNIVENALKRFPRKPLDLADAWFWCWWHLTGGEPGSGRSSVETGSVVENYRG